MSVRFPQVVDSFMMFSVGKKNQSFFCESSFSKIWSMHFRWSVWWSPCIYAFRPPKWPYLGGRRFYNVPMVEVFSVAAWAHSWKCKIAFPVHSEIRSGFLHCLERSMAWRLRAWRVFRFHSAMRCHMNVTKCHEMFGVTPVWAGYRTPFPKFFANIEGMGLTWHTWNLVKL